MPNVFRNPSTLFQKSIIDTAYAVLSEILLEQEEYIERIFSFM